MSRRDEVIENLKNSNMSLTDKNYVIRAFRKLKDYEDDEKEFNKMFLDFDYKDIRKRSR